MFNCCKALHDIKTVPNPEEFKIRNVDNKEKEFKVDVVLLFVVLSLEHEEIHFFFRIYDGFIKFILHPI